MSVTDDVSSQIQNKAQEEISKEAVSRTISGIELNTKYITVLQNLHDIRKRYEADGRE